MKIWKLAALIFLLAASSACTIEEESGLLIKGMLPCDAQDEFPQETNAVWKGGGMYDILVGQYYSPNDMYRLHVALENIRDNSENSSFGQGEGNTLRVQHFEVEYSLPTDWDAIEKIHIPKYIKMYPGNKYITTINIIPNDVRKAIAEIYKNNSYMSMQPFSVLRPPAGTACTTDEDCPGGIVSGYACDADSGTCMNACSLREGCAEGYSCDLGPDNEGYCRQECLPGFKECPTYVCGTNPDNTVQCKEVCRAGETDNCIPGDQIVDGLTIIDHDCISGMCIPDTATVNPHLPETISVKITAVAKDVGGGTVRSNTYKFPLQICRSCLLSVRADMCECTPLLNEYTTCFENYWEAYYGDVCDANPMEEIMQDFTVECSWIPTCYNQLCSEE